MMFREVFSIIQTLSVSDLNYAGQQFAYSLYWNFLL